MSWFSKYSVFIKRVCRKVAKNDGKNFFAQYVQICSKCTAISRSRYSGPLWICLWNAFLTSFPSLRWPWGASGIVQREAVRAGNWIGHRGPAAMERMAQYHEKDLVLVGGGHAHVGVLKMLAMRKKQNAWRPNRQTRVTQFKSLNPCAAFNRSSSL